MTGAVRRRAMPGGSAGLAAVGAGLAVYGLATYAFLALAGRALSVTDFTPVSVLWTVLNAVGIGLFVPFEQEIARRTAAARALGVPNQSLVRQAVAAAAILLLTVTVLAGVLMDPLSSRLFGGRTALIPLLLGAMGGMALSYVARGLLSGNALFGHYGAQLATDGAIRVAAAGLLSMAHAARPELYAAVLLVAPVLAVAITTPRPRSLITMGAARPPEGTRRALVALVSASVLSQALANAGPVIVQLLAGKGDEAAAGLFTAALVVARVPLFAFAAVQAILLPRLAALAGSGDHRGLRRQAGLVAGWTGALAMVGTLAIWLLGPWLVPALFGTGFAAARSLITAIAASGGAFMLAQVAAQISLALGRERSVVVGWAVGLAALLLTCLWQAPIDVRAAAALTVGAVAAFLALGVGAYTGERSWYRTLQATRGEVPSGERG